MVLAISQNSQENACARVSFLIKLQGACNFIKKETLARWFPVSFAKFLRTASLQNTSWRLLLKKTFSPKTKQKKHSKTQVREKNLTFLMMIFISFFFISPLHVWWRLPYITKDVVVKDSEDFKTA